MRKYEKKYILEKLREARNRHSAAFIALSKTLEEEEYDIDVVAKDAINASIEFYQLIDSSITAIDEILEEGHFKTEDDVGKKNCK